MNPDSRQHSASPMEWAVAAHVITFVVGVSWAFGGNADWVRTPLSIWGSVGVLLTLAAWATRPRGARRSPAFVWALPVMLLNLLVVISCLTPGFQYVGFGGEMLMMPKRIDWWIPSTARAGLSLRALWLFDGIYFSCLNLSLAVVRRKTLRLILAVVVANALALSIFGTVQKLAGSTGIYFGSVKTPHPQFFASFVYDNHWGAFCILMIAMCIGLVLRYAFGVRGDGFFNGPAPAGLVTVILIGLTIPLSGSRACTMLLAILVILALFRGVPTISRALRVSGATPTGALAGMTAAGLVAIGCIWMVAGDVIEMRTAKTREQVAQILAQGGLGSRSALYHDTWRMGRERLLFGWGMGSYPSVFPLFNSQESRIDHLPVIYHDAHSDWLQSVAEIGLVGTALIGAAVGLPLFASRRARLPMLSFFLLSGCVLIAAYAWIEFPFGNVAVVLVWWLCYFSAIQYIRLTGERTSPLDGP